MLILLTLCNVLLTDEEIELGSFDDFDDDDDDECKIYQDLHNNTAEP